MLTGHRLMQLRCLWRAARRRHQPGVTPCLLPAACRCVLPPTLAHCAPVLPVPGAYCPSRTCLIPCCRQDAGACVPAEGHPRVRGHRQSGAGQQLHREPGAVRQGEQGLGWAGLAGLVGLVGLVWVGGCLPGCFEALHVCSIGGPLPLSRTLNSRRRSVCLPACLPAPFAPALAPAPCPSSSPALLPRPHPRPPVQQVCKQNRWATLSLTGDLDARKRQARVDEFNSPAHPSFVLLLSSKAGGCGLNIVGANRLILLDPRWARGIGWVPGASSCGAGTEGGGGGLGGDRLMPARLLQLEPRGRPAGHGAGVAGGAAEGCLHLPPAHHGQHRGEDLSAPGAAGSSWTARAGQ